MQFVGQELPLIPRLPPVGLEHLHSADSGLLVWRMGSTRSFHLVTRELRWLVEEGLGFPKAPGQHAERGRGEPYGGGKEKIKRKKETKGEHGDKLPLLFFCARQSGILSDCKLSSSWVIDLVSTSRGQKPMTCK